MSETPVPEEPVEDGVSLLQRKLIEKDQIRSLEEKVVELHEEVRFWLGEDRRPGEWPPENEEWLELAHIKNRTPKQQSRIDALGTIITFKSDDRLQWERAEKAEKERDDLKAQLKDAGLLLLANATLSWDALSPEQHTELNRIVADIEKPIQAQLAQVMEKSKAVLDYEKLHETGGHPWAALAEALSSIPETDKVLVDEEIIEKARKWDAVCSTNPITNAFPDEPIGRQIQKANNWAIEVSTENESLQAKNEKLQKVIRQGFGVVDGLVWTREQKQWVEVAQALLKAKP